jgi:hypothetical protein
MYIHTPHFPYILQKFPEFPGGSSGKLVSDEAVEWLVKKWEEKADGNQP